MKYILSLLIALTCCTFSYCTNDSILFAKILDSQKKYYKEGICKSIEGYDSAYYRSILIFAKQNRILLLNKIKEIDGTFMIDKLSKFYIMEGWNGAHGYLRGTIWSDSFMYEYSWSLDHGIKVVKLSKKTKLMEDIERWDSTVKSHSICCSDVTDGLYYICSRIERGIDNDLNIESVAFYEYK